MLLALVSSAALSLSGADMAQYKHCQSDSGCVAVMGVYTYQAINKNYAEELAGRWKKESANVECFSNESFLDPSEVSCKNKTCERQ